MSKIVDVLTSAITLAVQNGRGDDLEYMVKDVLSQLDTCYVKVWREDETVKLPTYAKPGDACMDVYVHSIEYKDDGRVVYHTGLHFALPKDYEMEIRPRSSNTKTLAVMQNAPGTLDGGYRGELMLVHRQIDDPTSSCAEYSVGDRVAQILVRRRERIVWDEVETQDTLGATDRGEGGFGSTEK
jgi:dUTP pyrophosphatase